MTGRDRILIGVVLTLGVVGVMWMVVLNPKRKEAAKLGHAVAAQRERLDTARAEVTASRTAQQRFASDYTTVALEPAEDAGLLSPFSEVARVTRCTPSIRRSRAIVRATWLWSRVQPTTSSAGAWTVSRRLDASPPPAFSSCVSGATVPCSELSHTSGGRTIATFRITGPQSKRLAASERTVS